ncbi:30S ribosomal protein S12 technical knockout [Rhynchophorus ferrugineus]|uniref:30S ribosomal protein S12 technical knockout n=1 Tax=Rhynchophorus ferrugineus TaxID=354439 RepID=UPI003FCC73E9
MSILSGFINSVKTISNCVSRISSNIKLHDDSRRCLQSQSLDISSILSNKLSALTGQERSMATLSRMHRTGPHKKERIPKRPLDGNPFMKGVVLRTVVKKPKKPNSANRKSVLVRLANGKEMVAYIPGIGHNLQEHNIVLCRVGRVQDCPGVKLKCVRGKFDLSHVIKQK